MPVESTTGIKKTASTNKKHVQHMESGIQGVESRIQQCLGFLYMGRRHRTSPQTKKKICEEEIEEKKQTDLRNGSLNAQWFLNLNPS